MKFTGERYIPGISGFIGTQHYSRYLFASNIINLNDRIVLDIACGEGFGTNLLSIKSKYVFGIDISAETIEHAKNKYKSVNLEFIEGSILAIPLKDRSVDVVVCFETIEHISEHYQMMREIKRVMKPNGILIISSPNKDYYDKYFPDTYNDFHINELSEIEFNNLLKENFIYHKVYKQNDFFGSYIIPKNIDNGGNILVFDLENLDSNSLETRFSFCIASDKEINLTDTPILCSDNTYLNELVEKGEELNKITATKKWKIYVFIRRLLRWQYML